MIESIEKGATADSCAVVEAGICGFGCRIEAYRTGEWESTLRISETDCDHIRQLAEKIDTVSMQEVFAPFSRNPVFAAAQQVECHASCVVPAAILKTAEAAMGVALPRQVTIHFEACNGTETDERQ